VIFITNPVKKKLLVNLKWSWKGCASLLFLLTVLYGCTKIKSTEIGSDLIPAVDNVFTFDTTLDVITDNYLFADSTFPRLFRGTGNAAPETVLGFVSNDPQFGKTTGSIFLELKPPSYRFYFDTAKEALFLDSVVLCIKWNSTQGDTNALQKIDVYELNDWMKEDSAYRTDATFSYTTLLGSKTFAPKILDDSIFPRGQNLKNQLRIRLNDSFGRKLLDQDSAAGKPYNNDSSFREFFKGFAIVPDFAGGGSSGNALMNMALSDTNTYLRIYYRFLKSGKEDTTTRSFVFNNGIPGAFANNITRTYTGSQISDYLNNTASDSLVYIQTAPGSHAVVRMPSLNGFKTAKGNVLVHRAELFLQQVSSTGESDELFAAPDLLYVDYYDSAKTRQTPLLADGFPDNTYSSFFLGGARKYVVNSSGKTVAEYRFTLNRHIQGIITRNENNYPLQLYAPFTVTYPQFFLGLSANRLARGRVKLGGGNHSAVKMKLRIIYSKI
jgi:hypothetical protein